MVRLTIYRGEERIREQDLSTPVTALGRHTDNDVVLDDLALSRFHARLEERGRLFVIVDLGSQNGVYVNGTRISGEHILHAGDRIGMGRYVAVFDAQGAHGPQRESHPSVEVPAPLEPGSPASGPSLLLQCNGTEMERFPLAGDGYVIGRSHRCDIVIGLLGLSRRHARVFPAEGGWQVEDLGSQNGTFVNEQRIAGAYALKEGDTLNFFEYALVFQGGGGTGAVAAPGTVIEDSPSELRLDPVEDAAAPAWDPTITAGDKDAASTVVSDAAENESGSLVMTALWPSPSEVDAALLASRQPGSVGHLEVHADGRLLTEVPVQKTPLRIGCDARCDVALPPLPGIAAWHLLVVPLGATALLVRVGNARAPVVGGRGVFQGFIQDGDRVDLGRVFLVYRTR